MRRLKMTRLKSFVPASKKIEVVCLEYWQFIKKLKSPEDFLNNRVKLTKFLEKVHVDYTREKT